MGVVAEQCPHTVTDRDVDVILAEPAVAASDGGVGSAPTAGPRPRVSSLGEARVRVGLTKTELARRLHVSRPTVALWESGARSAARVYWPALCSALALDAGEVEWLFAALPASRHDGRRLPALARARRRAGLTQRELAGRLGVAPTTLSMWEIGDVPVREELLGPLSELLATDVLELARTPQEASPTQESRPLRGFRRDIRMTQREAAAHLRISVGSLARYEAGLRSVPMLQVRRMAVIYQRAVREVLEVSGREVHPLPPVPWSTDDLPDVVHALRSARGLSKEELGRALGLSGQAVRSWEAGRSRPRPVTLRRLEAMFGLRSGRLPSPSRARREQPARARAGTAVPTSTTPSQTWGRPADLSVGRRRSDLPPPAVRA